MNKDDSALLTAVKMVMNAGGTRGGEGNPVPLYQNVKERYVPSELFEQFIYGVQQMASHLNTDPITKYRTDSSKYEDFLALPRGDAHQVHDALVISGAVVEDLLSVFKFQQQSPSGQAPKRQAVGSPGGNPRARSLFKGGFIDMAA